jgi:hypothetical protein
MRARDVTPSRLRRGLDSTLLLVSWCIWKERNATVFDGRSSTVSQLVGKVMQVMDEWISAGFTMVTEFLVLPAAA